MGVRVYNPATGQFSSEDPVYGGNSTAYTYPQDPLNVYDLDGQWGCSWCKKAWKKTKTHAKKHWKTYAVAGVCIAASAGACVVAGVASAGLNYASNGRKHGFRSRKSLRRLGADLAWTAAGGAYGRTMAKSWRGGAFEKVTARVKPKHRLGGSHRKGGQRSQRRSRVGVRWGSLGTNVSGYGFFNGGGWF